MLRVVLRAQAMFYLLTGLWPLASLSTFEAVTGPKTDDWLVHMVGLLAASIGVTLWIGAKAAKPAGAVIFLAAASAASFAAIDLTYALSERISDVYLLDAAAEIVLLPALAGGWLRARRRP
jgi:energy-converting hydrogenase Eha subunit E